MKTVKQWLETLPKELRESALKQADKPYLNVLQSSLSESVLLFKTWRSTEEGVEFWRSFFIALKQAESEDNNVR